MVGYIMLMKLLHCKYKRPQKYKNTDRYTTETKYTGKVNIKKENDYTCRVCLKNGDIPIFGNDDSADISQEFRLFSDLQINRYDIYPKYLCQSCHSLLQGAILFRKTARLSDENLQRSFLSVTCENDDNTESENNCESKRTAPEPNKPTSYNFRCKPCDLMFLTIQEYTDHRLSLEHENMRKVCPTCHKSYKAIYFKRHLALHKREPSYMCDICGKKFIIQGQFTRHRAIHTSDLPFKCPLCPYRGRFRESLKSHMHTHTGEKPYQCSECPSRFVSKSNLNKHMLTHKPEHDFKCESCGRGFYTKRSLELHFKVDHTGIKEHVCNLCGKSFGYRKQMMKHQVNVHKRQKMKSGRLPLYLQVEAQSNKVNSN